MKKILAQGSEKNLQIKDKIDKCFSLGAEAVITLNNKEIIKDRIKKSYRLPILDERLRKSRTRSEAKIIGKLFDIIPVPRIIKTDENASHFEEKIVMEFIDGKKLSENLENLDYKKICKLIGENISKMHDKGIIHGDLTTSNMIYVENLGTNCAIDQDINSETVINNIKSARKVSKRSFSSNINQLNKSEIANFKGKVFFIDFGLAFHSNKIEDKAVDLHLLKQALEAKHFTINKECFEIILKNYRPEKYKEIIDRIKVIESRGRYKDKY